MYYLFLSYDTGLLESLNFHFIISTSLTSHEQNQTDPWRQLVASVHWHWCQMKMPVVGDGKLTLLSITLYFPLTYRSIVIYSQFKLVIPPSTVHPLFTSRVPDDQHFPSCGYCNHGAQVTFTPILVASRPVWTPHHTNPKLHTDVVVWNYMLYTYRDRYIHTYSRSLQVEKCLKHWWMFHSQNENDLQMNLCKQQFSWLMFIPYRQQESTLACQSENCWVRKHIYI